ncbi:branched-chain amino acid ABC transporter permease [Dictyobacter arantiisoli]|uniref:Branched-chain amino acid transporter membrane protein n=1 Tax=Dictyobacter arantiisoli TaxID=2014874 RepID=A0A5A5TJW3_9CHLR|nr:branched-chain amino acid ABC transporter permease [Dictyobacter arantiisoli]GCF11319.1 branched-chain amino acid transporter membrane protein [Dictyobacter arantiisoli]
MKKAESIILLIILVFLAIFPLIFSNPSTTSVAFFAVIFAVAAAGWNIFSGYTGYVSLGYAVFSGVGAYSLALICQKWNIAGGYTPFAFVLVAGLIAAVFALPVGWIILRTRRHVFVVVTVATLFIMQLLAYNLEGFTGGSAGITLPLPSWTGDFFNMPFYYGALILLVVAVSVSWLIRHSKFGLGLLAIREDEDRARSLGINTTMYKLIALMISAFFAGTVGAMISYFTSTVFPAEAFDPLFDIAVALMAFFGGVGTLAGPIIGALLLETLQQYMSLQFSTVGLDLILFGGLLLVVILLLPEGIVPSLFKLVSKMRASHESTPIPSSSAESTDSERLAVKEGKNG